MRIGFNARLLYAPTLRGWNRYTVNLIEALLPLGVEAILFSDQPVQESHLARFSGGKVEVRVSTPMNYFRWEQSWLPRECAQAKVDVLHCPFNFGLPFWSHCPRVLTLHDGIDQIYYRRRRPLRERVRLNSLKMDFLNWIARTRAERIITVSEHARGDLVKHLGISPDKISVIYEAADPKFGQPICADDRRRVRAKYGLDCPYIFYIGGWEQRKNIPFLLTAFAQAALGDMHLVLAGGKSDQIAVFSEMSQKLSVSSRVHTLGWIDEDDLPALYAGALCFVYPSEYEGFGLQMCEAMAVGCPVLAARATSLPEILGSGGQTFGLENTQELENLLRQVAHNGANRTLLQSRAKARSREFSWAAAALKTLAVYRAVMNTQ